MLLYKLAVIHTIEMITCQNERIFCASLLNFDRLFAHRIGRALIPVHAGRFLLCRQNLHPTRRKHITIVSTMDVPV